MTSYACVVVFFVLFFGVEVTQSWGHVFSLFRSPTIVGDCGALQRL